MRKIWFYDEFYTEYQPEMEKLMKEYDILEGSFNIIGVWYRTIEHIAEKDGNIIW